MDQTNIFEYLYPKYHLTKPIRLIECFAGYGSQALSLEYLGVPFEHWKICEWNYKSFQAYKQLHMTDDNTDYSIDLNKEEIIEYLTSKNISADWNKPMKLEQIKRLSEDKMREIYNNIQTTHNLVDISQVHGNDLEIINPDQYTYIMTYSFPCQDLSLAGLRKGMEKGGSTRSGMLWEVERILHELKEKGHLPDVLLMENVPQVHGVGNEEHFREWQLALEKMGYSNYWQDLIATDYGIPQIRNRCFMVSILGEWFYDFPKPTKLQIRLRDLLEKEPDVKYSLSEQQIQMIRLWNAYEKPLEKMEITEKQNISPTLTTRSGDYTAGMILVKRLDNRVKKTNNVAIKNATKQGYLEAEDGDGVDISARTEYRRGTVAMPTNAKMIGMVPKGIGGSYLDQARRVYDNEQSAPTLMTREGGIVGWMCENRARQVADLNYFNHEQSNRIYSPEAASPTITTKGIDDARSIKITDPTNKEDGADNLRIRKLTPRECFRLQGVKDADIDKLSNMSNSTLYHLAGDSIVTTVLMAIFGELLEIEWKEKVNSLHRLNNDRRKQ